MKNCPKVTVVIPNWNTQGWLPGCLAGLTNQRYQDFQIVVVDNGSTDDSVPFLQQHYPEVEILAFPENRGFAPAVNAGIQASSTDYVALLNVDTVPQRDWLANLVAVMDQSPPDVGGAASKMLSLDNPTLLDDAGNTFSWYGSANKRGRGQVANTYDQMEEILSISGGAGLYRRSFLEDVGHFDEKFVSYLEDVDLGLRGQLGGYRFLYVPAARILHKSGGASIARPRYVLFSTRNRLMLLLKNIPLTLLWKHRYTLLFGQFYFFLVYKKPLYSLAGYISFLRNLPYILRQRRVIQKNKTISNETLERMLSNRLGEPRLRDIVRDKLGRSSKKTQQPAPTNEKFDGKF